MNNKVLERSLDYIKDWLRFRYEREDIPGFAVTVAHKGRILFNEAYGYANLEKKEKLTPDHIFRIASHSKTFTAVAIMQLQEQERLRLDDNVVKYLSWLKKHQDKRWQNVTIRQLLSHSAGVIRDGLNQDYWAFDGPFPDKARLIKDFSSTELVLENNTTMKYSNYGYSLLGLVVEAASGMEFNDYTKKHIVEPLELKSIGPEFTNKIKDRLVTGYTRAELNKKRLPIADVDTRAMSPATGFYSTGKDLCQYFTTLITGSGKLLSDESKKEMQRTQWHLKNEDESEKEDYGLGLMLGHVDKTKVFGHSGGFPGQGTKTLCDPKNKLVVVVMVNAISGGASSKAKDIFKVINYFQEKDRASSENNFEKFEGRFMNLWTVADLVAQNDRLVHASPESWEPFNNPDELKYLGDNTFKVVKTNSFGDEGELVKYNFAMGKVKSVVYAGATLLPERDYLKDFSKKKTIE